MNASLKNLLDNYSLNHQSSVNRRIHKFAVPLIVLSLLGILHQLRIMALTADWIFIFFSSFYYFRFKNLSVLLIVYMQLIPMMLFIYFNPFSSLWFYLIVFAAAWVAQFVGHKIEGKKPSFLEDLQYLLIGPIWILRDFISKN